MRHILGSRDRVTMIRGAAGTGKTTLMQEAVEHIEKGGHSVVVLATSSGASRDVLREEAGFADADTVARFLVDRDMQQRAAGQVIWVDEASLLSNKDMDALFDVADSLDARVILMGDRRQHGSVAAGSPLKLLEQQAGVPSVEVTEIMRQDGDYKKAAHLLSEGRTDEGLDTLDELGWVREVPDDERYLRMAEAYLAASAEKKRDGSAKRALVVSPTHAEGDRITGVIRKVLAAQGKLARGAPVHGLCAAASDRGGAGRGRQLRARRYDPVPPERQGLQVRPAAGGGGWPSAPRSGRPVPGVPRHFAATGGRGSWPVHGERLDGGWQAPAE